MITDVITELEQKLETILLDSELKTLLTSKLSMAKSEAERILADLKRTTDESVGRKNKLGLLSNTVLDLQTKLTQMDLLKQLNLKLAVYKQKAIELKQNEVAKLKNLFDMKLSNATNKDYHRYKNISTQFNFLDQSEEVLAKNLLVYRVLLVAGVFDNDKQMLRSQLPKSNTDDKSKSTKNKLF